MQNTSSLFVAIIRPAARYRAHAHRGARHRVLFLGRKSTAGRTSPYDRPSPSRIRGSALGLAELGAWASAYPVQLCGVSVALTASKATLKACQGCPRTQLRQFGAGHDACASAPSAFDRELQAEADKVTGRADMLCRHDAAVARKERNRNKWLCGYWGKQTIGAA